ncbi:GNAT family N-acetyltransferase [Luminiphilus sp.]|jgi:ElaA protein|nr:GNAT family N-acetyltransferase [Luminiphilus sp.]
MEHIKWRWRHFDTMSAAAWHEVLALRSQVFVVEQECAYQDPDPKDPLCWHLTGHLGDELVAGMRVVPPGVSYDECSIGRVVVPTSLRGQKRGVQLMAVGINFCESRWNNGIRISGQAYLKGFYEALGFETVQGPYMEDDIPHFEMLKPGS